MSNLAVDAERLQLTEPEAELAQASDALAELGRTLSPVAVETFAPLEEALRDWRTPRAFGDLGSGFPALLHGTHARLDGEAERNAFNRAFVAHLASHLRFGLDERALPFEVLGRVPAALDRLHGFLSEHRESYDLGDDYFLKDVRFAAGWTVPCGAKVVDLRSRLSLPISLVTALRGREPSLAVRALGSKARALVRAPHRVAISGGVQRGRDGGHLPLRGLASAPAPRSRRPHRLRLAL